MSPAFLPIITALTQLVPAISKLLEKDVSATEKIVDVAKAITNTTNNKDIIQALKTDAHLRLKLEHKIAQLSTELERISAVDRNNARHRDRAIIRVGKSNVRADIMVVAAALGLISCLLCLVFFQHELPGEAVGIISTIAGIFGACLKDAYAFEFGSSRGSKNKDEHVAALIRRVDVN